MTKQQSKNLALTSRLTPTAADMRKTGLALRNAIADAIERDRRKATVAR
jgi:hypothetical protein